MAETGNPRRYLDSELLQLRNSLPAVCCNLAKINKHLGIAGILRIPEQAFRDPHGFSCKTRSLVDMTRRRLAPHPTNRHSSRGNSDEGEHKAMSPMDWPQDTQRVQWHLRPRESSDYSDQPHSAPTGILAQQSENFQRFYRAVVSPTHVRVTAGGRIVPNTRVKAPPTLDWDGEQGSLQPRKHLADTDPSVLQSPPWAQSMPMLPSFPQILPSALRQYNQFAPSNNLTLPNMATHSSSRNVENHSNQLEERRTQNIGAETTVDSLTSAHAAKTIKISPPSQFDHSRPFVINGQVVYPVPPGMAPSVQALPVTMLGNPNLMHQYTPAAMGNFWPVQNSMAMNPFAPLANSSQQPLGGVANVLQPLENLPSISPFAVQPTIFSGTDFMKNQIQILRNQLKHLDNQLANNKHQINEDYVRGQQKEVSRTIEQLESVFTAQQAQGNDGLYRTMNTEAIAQPQDLSGLGVGQNGSSTSYIPQHNIMIDAANTSQPIFAKPPKVPVYITAAKDKSSNTSKSDDHLHKVLRPDSAGSTSQSEPSMKSRLTVAAALAPPFKPRAQPTRDVKSTGFSAQVEHRGYEPSTVSAAELAALSNMSKTKEKYEGSASSWNEERNTVPQGQQTVQGVSSSIHASLISPQAVPYLVGLLPQGSHPSDAHPNELVYSRPLTNQEIKARELYWGKASRSAHTGLPKFDGKDFYPPSPVKEFAKPASDHKETTNSEPVDLDRVFTKSLVMDTETILGGSVSPKTSSMSIAGTPTSKFLQNSIIGYQSPSPRPSRYRFDNYADHNRHSDSEGAASHDMGPPPFQQIRTTRPVDVSVHSTPEITLFGPKINQEQHSVRPATPSSFVRKTESLGGHGVERPIPATPKNFFNDGTEDEDGKTTVDSWGASTEYTRWVSQNKAPPRSIVSDQDDANSDSTVDIRLTSQNSGGRPPIGEVGNSTERALNFNGSDHHNMLLQNLLKNSTHATMSAPALSGAVSSATAKGFLPPYRGSAAASLAPAALSSPGFERDKDEQGLPVYSKTSTNGGTRAALVADNFLPENRPLNRDRSPRAIRVSPEAMTPETYLRFISQKKEEDTKIIEQGWNPNTTATGPVSGSNW